MSNPLVAGCAAVTREYLQAQGIAKPSAALGALTGQSIQGNWTLQIQDLDSRDTGKLDRWGVEIQGQ